MSAETLTHALTVHQPYAWALAAGHKPVENRTWRPPLEMVGKLVGIHAGKTLDEDAQAQFVLGTYGRETCAHLPVDPLPLGALIGVARLAGVVKRVPTNASGGFRFEQMRGASVSTLIHVDLHNRIRPWWRGPWGWLLEEAVLLPEPVPMRGQKGLWRLPGPPLIHGRLGESAGWALEQWRKAREVVR